MKVSGFALRDALSLQALRRDTAARAFEGSLKVFPGDEKETPQQVVESFIKAESAIAELQEAQMVFNLHQRVSVKGFGEMTLARAIKLVGGAGRVEKMWKAAVGPKPDRYGGYRNDDERDPGKITARVVISPSAAVKLAAEAAKRSGALRAAIADANLRTMELDLEPELFE